MIKQSFLSPSTEASDSLNISLPIQQTLLSEENQLANVQALFIQQIVEILLLRWPKSKFDKLFSYGISRHTDVNSRFFGVVTLKINCRNTAEAVLTAEVIETILTQTYQINSRISTQYFPVNFTGSKNPLNPEMTIILHYQPVDYVNVHKSQALNCDQQLMMIFKEPENDYYDYFALRENIPNIKSIQSSREMLHVRQDLQEAAEKSIDNDGASECSPIEYKAKILFITAIGLGSGNYMHALRAITQLSEKMPQLQMDWILADYHLPTPKAAALPPQVTLHQSRMLYQQFPLIQSLSLTVDLIIGLPNKFLDHLQDNFSEVPMLMSNRCPYLSVIEYNIDESEPISREPLYDVILQSGINTKKHPVSLGIIKPDCMQFPVERNLKKQALQKYSQCAIIFADHPDVPLYFSYVYAPKPHMSNSQIMGLQNIDVLAFFIQYAKRREEHHIKVMLSIRLEDIQNAKKMYPRTFADCTIQLYSHPKQAQDKLADGKLVIQIYDIFPVDNEVFRALSDYASSWDTPVVMTGDQSFLELFFTENHQPVVLYQLLSHKKGLFQAIKNFAEFIDAKHLCELFRIIENRFGSEDQLVALADFVLSHYQNIQLEFQTLKLYIQDQPDLVDSLSRVIPTVIQMNSQLLEQRIEKEEAISLFVKAFDTFAEEGTDTMECIKKLERLNNRVTPFFSLKSLLTDYYFELPLFTPIIIHDEPKLFNDLLIYLIQQNEEVLFLPITKNRLSQTLLEIFFDNNKSCYQDLYIWLLNNKGECLQQRDREYSMLKIAQEKIMLLLKNNQFKEIQASLKGMPTEDVHKIILMNNHELIEDLLDASIDMPEALDVFSLLIDQDIRLLDIDLLDEQGNTLLDYFCDDPNGTYTNFLCDILNKHEKKLSEYQLIKFEQLPLEKEKSNDSVKIDTIACPLEIKSSPLITQATLAPYWDSESPWQLDNPALLDLINTDAKTESIILDAIIDRILRNPLIERGILVLPTQRSTEAISLTLFNRIKQGVDLSLFFTVGVEIVHGQIEAIVAEKVCSRPNYIVYPINIEGLVHFGMLIIDLSDINVPISAARAYYIEPLKWMDSIMHDTATENTFVSQQPAVNEIFYQNYVHQLNAELNISPDSFRYIRLGQMPDVNYCADYVLSVLMLLASGEINLAEPISLMNLQGRYLTKSDTKAIRLLAIQQFGKDYLQLQLRNEFKGQNIDTILNAAEKKLRIRTASDQSKDDCQPNGQIVKREKYLPQKPSPLRHVENAVSLAASHQFSLFSPVNFSLSSLNEDVFKTKAKPQ